jgi:G:T-mismatch repair DNA endonuclease (very short patch repair protein)
VREKLEAMGWSVRVIWTCELEAQDELKTKLKNWFGASNDRDGRQQDEK